MGPSDFDTALDRLAAIVEHSDDAIISKTLDGTITSWNRAAERMFGYTAAEAIGRSIRMIVPDDRQAEENDVLRRIANGETVHHFETVRRRKDGTQVPISLSASPLRNAAGEIVGASKIARDISARKHVEMLLGDVESMQADLQQRLLALVAASGTLLTSPRVEHVLPATLKLAAQIVTADGYAVWRLGDDRRSWHVGSYQGISDEFAKRIVSPSGGGASPGNFTDAIVAEDVAAAPSLQALGDAYRKEGIISMLAVPLVIDGQASGSLVFYYRHPHRFTTAERQTALALSNLASAAISAAELYDIQRRSRAQSDFLAEAGGVLATSLDYEETLKRVANLAVPHFADWCAVDLINESGEIQRLAVAHADPAKVDLAMRFQERFPEDPRSPYSVKHVLRTGAAVLLEHLTPEMIAAGARDDEHRRAVEALDVGSFMIVPLVAHGRTLGAISFAAASSSRRYTQPDLQFAQNVASRAALAVDNARAYDEARRANQLKDDFLATLSHELRTPLNAILGYSRMLKTGSVGEDRLARAFEILEKNATGLTQIVEDVLDVSRIVSGKIRLNVQQIDLGSILTQSIETVRPAADAKGVRLHVAVDPSATAVAGDPDRLQQVVWNLLANAVKFTPRGGLVQAHIERVGSNVEIVVSDTGIGISPEFLPHLFERFRQADSRFAREHGGLGLGLAISRHLVEMHGGTIRATSDGPGTGAIFRVMLPLMIGHVDPLRERQSVALAAERTQESSPIRLDGVSVLVVDDDQDALTMLRQILEGSGAEVTTVHSAQEALDTIHSTTPNVLLTDIGMPLMDGFELIERVRQDGNEAVSDVPAAALTAYARSEDRTRALRSGFQMHVAKPIDPDELIAVVNALVQRKSSRS